MAIKSGQKSSRPKNYVVNVSKAKRDRVVVTMKCHCEVLGCALFAVVTGNDEMAIFVSPPSKR